MDLSEWLEKSYEELNVEKYELLYIYADLRGFIEVAKPRNRDSFLESIIKGLIAKGITILIPTFNIRRRRVSRRQNKTKLGALNKYYDEENSLNLAILYFRTQHLAYAKEVRME